MSSLPRWWLLTKTHPPLPEAAINDLSAQTFAQAAPPRAKGAVRLAMRAGQRLGALHQAGSLKVLFPRTDGTSQAILVNTAGGITGGDRFDVMAEVASEAALTLSTQAAERAYRAAAGATGTLTTHLTVKGTGDLRWLPQETILFEGCALRRRLRIDLDPESQCTLVEPLVFGRAAMGETLSQAHFEDEIRLYRSGKLSFLDRTHLQGDLAQHLRHPAVAAGAGAMALALHAAPNAARHLDAIRALLPQTAGASAISDDLLVIRALAEDSFALRQFLIPVLSHLTGEDLPRPWML